MSPTLTDYEVAGDAAVGATLTINVPTVSDGDRLVCVVGYNASSAAVLSMTGWTKHCQVFMGGSDFGHLAVFSRVASSEPSTYNVDVTVATGGEIQATMVSVADAPGALLVAPGPYMFSATAIDFYPPSVAKGSLVVAAMVSEAPDYAVTANPTGTTLLDNSAPAGGTNNATRLVTWTKAAAESGTPDLTGGTVSNATGGRLSAVIAFQPSSKDVRPTAPSTKVETFTSSGTFTLDPRAREVIVQVVGGGGGAGSGRRGATSTVRQGGAGGGGGAYSQATFKAADLTSTVAVTIGAAGTGGAAVTANDTDGNAGTAGGTSSFGAYLAAVGGNFGAKGSSTGTPAGGAPTTGPQTDPGTAGGNASATGAGGIQGAVTSVSRAPSGGGSAAGITSANALNGPGAGGIHNLYGVASGGAAGTAVLPGSIGPTVAGIIGLGGGGGRATAAFVGQDGGNGGLYGGGGGGGSPSLNGNNSGKGGDGGPGCVRVITLY